MQEHSSILPSPPPAGNGIDGDNDKILVKEQDHHQPANTKTHHNKNNDNSRGGTHKFIVSSDESSIRAVVKK